MSQDQNENRWQKLFDGFSKGDAIVRFRGDMKSQNTVMRDPVLFRIIEDHHPLLDKKYRVWPSYDFAVAIEDSLDGITHAFRSKEYELRNELLLCNFRCIKHEKTKDDGVFKARIQGHASIKKGNKTTYRKWENFLV